MTVGATVLEYALNLARAGVAATLALSVGTTETAANRVGFFADLTASAEQLGFVVGGVTGHALLRNGTNVIVTGLKVQASTFMVLDPTDLTKALAFSLSGMTTAKTLTLASAQTTTQTLNVPNIAATDTLATLGLSQTFSGINTFSNATDATALGTGAVVLSAGGLSVNNQLRVGTYLWLGKTGSGSGGNIRYVNDAGTLQWTTGILGSVGATTFSLYNNVSGNEPISIAAATDIITFSGASKVVAANATASTGTAAAAVVVTGGIGAGDGFTLGQVVKTTGSPYVFKVTGAAHTTLTASTVSPDVNFALNRTVQFATGAVADLYAVIISPPQWGFVGASTVTRASTVFINGAPTLGTNAAFTNSQALYVSGPVTFDNRLLVGSTTQVATAMLFVSGNAATTGVDQYGFNANQISSSSATTSTSAIYATAQTTGSVYTCTHATSIVGAAPILGATSTITYATAIRAAIPASTVGVNNAGLVVGTATTTTYAGNFGVYIDGGTQTVLFGLIDTRITWNAAQTFTGWKQNVTDTSSNAASLLYDFQVGGTSRQNLRKDGLLTNVAATATTAAADGILTLGNNSTGTPAAGYGTTTAWNLKSSTTNDQNALKLDTTWVVATHASRTARAVLSVYDFTAARECLRLETSGTAAMVGFLGAAAVVQQALTVDHTDVLANFGLQAAGAGKIKTWRKTITAVNVNSAAADVGTFSNLPAKYRVVRLQAFDGSISLTTATVDLRTATGGAGTALVAAAAMASCTAATKFQDVTLAAVSGTDYQTTATLTVRNVTAQGVAATVSFMLEVIDLT